MPENLKKQQKQVRLSMEEQMAKMKLIFSNAKLPNVLPELKKIGYTEERIDGFLNQLTEVENLYQRQKKEYAEQYAETEKFNEKRSEIDEIYRRHLAFSKILFKGDTAAIASLDLNAGRKMAYGAWFQQVSNFYGQILSNPDLRMKLMSINIQDKDINDQKQALADLSALKESQKKETGEAQKATEARDKAFDALYVHYTELVDYAKVVFANDQTLEKLGIVVKR